MDESGEGPVNEPDHEANSAGEQTREIGRAVPQAQAPSGTSGRDWKTIALIAVSCLAVILLITTIGLAVTGDFGGNAGADRFGLRNRAPGRMPRDGYRFRQGPQQDEDDLPLERRAPDHSAPGQEPDPGTTPPAQSAPGQGSGT